MITKKFYHDHRISLSFSLNAYVDVWNFKRNEFIKLNMEAINKIMVYITHIIIYNA